jgi:MoaA/NifB/PqqE/SkfB family radical SAM enzyme
VDQVKPYCNQIAIGGKGDPQTHKNFKEIVEYTEQNNINCNYTSSGYNLTDEQVEISKKCKVAAISLGNPRPYSFTAIKKLQNAGVTTNIHLLLSKKSLLDVIALLQGRDIWGGLVDLTKINAIVLLSFKNQGKGKELSNMSLSDNDVRLILPYLRYTKDLPFKIGADSCFLCKIGKVDKFTKQEELFTDTCEASRYSMYVGPTMNMMPCSYGSEEIYGTSLKTNTIKDIWDNNEVFKMFRKKLKENPFKCPYGI